MVKSLRIMTLGRLNATERMKIGSWANQESGLGNGLNRSWLLAISCWKGHFTFPAGDSSRLKDKWRAGALDQQFNAVQMEN